MYREECEEYLYWWCKGLIFFNNCCLLGARPHALHMAALGVERRTQCLGIMRYKESMCWQPVKSFPSCIMEHMAVEWVCGSASMRFTVASCLTFWMRDQGKSNFSWRFKDKPFLTICNGIASTPHWLNNSRQWLQWNHWQDLGLKEVNIIGYEQLRRN